MDFFDEIAGPEREPVEVVDLREGNSDSDDDNSDYEDEEVELTYDTVTTTKKRIRYNQPDQV